MTTTEETSETLVTDSDEGQAAKTGGWLRYFGPGFLVAAAFIGPGTVNTAIKAGGTFGYQLLWAVGFAVLATIVFQEMAARLGLVTKKGLGEALTQFFPNSIVRYIALGLVLSAIVFGNAAYQSGNVSGAAQGMGGLIPGVWPAVWLILISGIAFAVIWKGDFQVLKLTLMGLVGLMSLAFVFSALFSRPAPAELLAGAVSFEIPWYNLGILIAIIGTTVVPYNLFLHASTVAEQFADIDVDVNRGEQATELSGTDDAENVDEVLEAIRADSRIAICLGGLVTAAILIVAAGTSAVNIKEADQMLTPTIGSFGRMLFLMGLFAAGLTSAITAPIAAGYAYAGCFGLPAKANEPQVKRVAMIIVGIGLGVGLYFKTRPEQILFLAQVANGLILPVIAIFLLVVMNSKSILGRYTNNWVQNVTGVAVVAFITLLAIYKLGSSFGWIG